MRGRLATGFIAGITAFGGILAAPPTTSAAPVLGGQLFSTGELIHIEVLSASAALTSELFLLEPEELFIATNREVGRQVTIGPYGSGEELIFGIRVSGREYRMGPADRNPDGVIHAVVDFVDDECAIVGFEDLFGGGDRDYDDNRFRFCGGIASEPPEPPEPPTPPPFVGPTADAGDDQTVPEGSVVTLDGSRSKASTLVTRTYTTTADFGEGTSINLTDVPPDQLQLDDTTEAFGFIWIAASARGTVVKIDTATGDVLGEYWSAPQNRAKDPSRTTVDHDGNVWVGNRAETSGIGGVAKGSVAKFGLAENGQCLDRNGNGVIDTSSGLGDIRPWPNASGVDNDGGVETAADECILAFVRTNGVAIRQVSVDAANDVWVGGAAQGGAPSFFDRLTPNGAIVRSINMRAPAQTGESGVVVCCYGGLVDPNGILWSSSGANTLVRIDPSKPDGDADLIRVINLGRTSYGMGIDPDGNIWDSNWTFNTVQKISPAGAILGTFPTGGPANDRGVAVTSDGDVWIANSGGSSVSRLRNNGSFVAEIGVGQEPTGVAIDALGKVWATNLSSSTASRIDPATNAVDLTVSLGAGAGPYNYSDMTGATLTGAPNVGTWSVVYDSGAADTAWAHVDWNAQITGDGALEFSVASSTDGATFTPEVAVTAGAPIAGLANGRYLRVTVQFTRSGAGVTPILYDLTVAHSGDRANTLSYLWRLVGVDGPPVFLSSTTSVTPSFVAPDDGTYRFELTVTDSAGLSDSDEIAVEVTNVNPDVKAQAGSAFARGVTLVNGSFTDAGWLDTHSATFNWGDGTAPDSVGVTAQGTGWGTFFGSHVYATAGTFSVSVTLIDDDGGSDTVQLGQLAVSEPVAIWANSKTEKKTFEWTGSGGTITGRVHSNNEVKIAGTLPKTIVGPTEYVKSIQIDGPHVVTPVKSTVQSIPLVYSVTDYAPGGPVSRAVGAAYVNHAAQCVAGRWDVGSAILAPGVHYAPCAVKVNGSSISGRITIVATGSIELSGSKPAFEPYYDGLLLLSGATGAKAINVSASASKFLGVIYAASGEVSLSGSDGRFFCGIYGDRVLASGSNLTVRGSNCGRPDSTVSGPLLVPQLELDLDADRSTTPPGGDIAYGLRVSNSGSLLVVPGLIGLENVDTSAANVTGMTYALEYFSIQTGTWTPIASLAAGNLTLTARANAAPGVTYPAPDAIIGTTVAPSGFATWGYQALVQLTPSQVQLLLDPTRVGGLRNRVDFTLAPSTVQVRRLFTFGTDFVAALRTLTGDISNPQVTFVPPAGDLITENGTTTPALASLTPGESVALDEAYVVPIPAPRSATETDAGYLSRLLALDNSSLLGSSFALGTGGVGQLVAPLVTASTTEKLPVVSISTLGPDAIPAGSTTDYELRVANLGSANAPTVGLTAAAGSDALPVSGEPGSLVSGQLATATTTYAASATNPPADVTITGAVTWGDGAGNQYGPVRSSHTSQILTPATLSATLVDTLQEDVGGDGQVSPTDTVRYTLTVSNHGGQPLANVVATVTPDSNSALDVGSVAAAGGTVVRGNGAADTSVEVRFTSVAGGGTATFTFDVTVDSPFPTGVSRLEVQGSVTADAFSPVLTDDPARPGLADATRTTVVVPVPNLTAFLSGRLFLDPDGNGFASAGDTLRYELVVNSVGSLAVSGVDVSVPIPSVASIVPGSVTTTQGTVNGGSSVSVSVGSLPSFTAATVRFDLQLTNPLPTGTSAISVQGTVGSVELADLATDDPNTFTVGDPTVIAVGTGTGGGGGTPGVPGPTIGSVSLAEGTVVTDPTGVTATITPPAGETVTAWTITARLEGEAGGQQIGTGSGTSLSGTVDPTVLANGAYVLEIQATGSAGGVSVATASFIVEGDLKLGRFSMTFEDLDLPIAGLPVSILRGYDTLDRSRSGDFGFGWNLKMANFRVATNGPLGQGGWRMFGCGGGLIFVPLCFDSVTPHYVTVTWPQGRVETFDLTPAKGSTFLSGLTSAQFTGRPGTTSTLQAADPSLYFSNGDLLGGFFGSEGIYNPTRFVLTDPQDNQYVLDTTGGLVSITTFDGNQITFGPNGIQTSVGPDVTFTRDPLGRISRITTQDGRHLDYEYDANGDLIRFTDASTRQATFGYQSGHYLTSSDGVDTPKQTLRYDPSGRLEAIVDAAGNETLVEVDVDAKTQLLQSPDGRLTRVFQYDDRGQMVTREDVFSGRTLTWSYEYDDGGRMKAIEDPEGNRAEATYDPDGNPLTIKEANGVLTEYTYVDGRPTQIKVGGEVVLNAAYEPGGRLTSVSRPGVPPRIVTYDGLGRIQTITDPVGRGLTYGYDANGYANSIATPTGSITYVNDASGRPTQITDQLSQTAHVEYDADGRMLAIVDPTGGRQEWTYNSFGAVATYRDKALATTTYEYDPIGQLARRVDRNGEITTYTHTRNGQLETITSPQGTTTYRYDPLDRPISIENADAVVALDWDDANTLIGQTTSGTASSNLPTVAITNEANTLGQPIRTSSLGFTTGYEYDPSGRIGEINDTATGSFAFTYDNAGRLDTMTRPNGVTDTYTWTDAGQMATRTAARSGVQLDRIAYGYGPSGFRSTLADAAGTHTFSYDDVGRLTGVDHPAGSFADEAYTYDGAGNRSRPGETTTYDNADRLVRLGGLDFVYDAEGRLTRRIVRSTGDTTTYTWDASGQLRRIGHPGGGETTFRYDGLGRRVEVNDRGTITRFAYDGPNLRHAFDASNHLVATFVTGSTVDSVLAIDAATGNVYPVRDALGSITSLTDAAGAVSSTSAHDGYGTRAGGPPATVTPFGYAGLVEDPTGLDYARARYYDPSSGRFISEDTIPGSNRYPYANDNPVNFMDPSGLQAMVEYSSQTEDDVPQACAASRAIVPMWDYLSMMVDVMSMFTMVPPGTAVFWSGPGAMEQAAEFARSTGRYTINMTLGGQWLEAQEQVIKELFGRDALRSLWARMSAAYANNAAGEVFAFTANSSPGSIWNTVEKPILEGKASVKINYMPKSPCG